MFYRVLGEPYTVKGGPRSLAIWGLGVPISLAIRARGGGGPYRGGPILRGTHIAGGPYRAYTGFALA